MVSNEKFDFFLESASLNNFVSYNYINFCTIEKHFYYISYFQ